MNNMPESPLKKKIREKKNIFGTMTRNLVAPIIIPALDKCGVDFLVVDQEHGPSTMISLQTLLIVAKKYEVSILVRPPSISYENIAKYLDLGVDGLMIPHVDTLEQIKEIIKYSQYPPNGSRGYGMTRSLSSWYEGENRQQYIQKANENTVLFIQVESQIAAENIGDLLSNDSIDGVIVGPADFSMDLGVIGDYTNKRLIKFLDHVLKTCKKKEKSFGIHFGDPALIKDWKKKGMNILMYGNLLGAMKNHYKNTIQQFTPKKNNQNDPSNAQY